jgi:hypothetical protein
MYTLNVRVATDVAGGVFHLALDGRDVSGSISVPQTNGWQTWQTLSVPEIRLPAGTHTLQMVLDTGGYYNTIGNFNWFSLEQRANFRRRNGLCRCALRNCGREEPRSIPCQIDSMKVV